MRVVIDTNVIVSAILKANSAPADVVRAGDAQQFDWITSTELLAELTRILSRPRIQGRTGFDDSHTVQFVHRVESIATHVEPTYRIDICRDPDDNRVLEAAIAGEADYIVTGDRDLLELGSYEGIRIVTPAEFVALLSALDDR